jgi:hypothetical protein
VTCIRPISNTGASSQPLLIAPTSPERANPPSVHAPLFPTRPLPSPDSNRAADPASPARMPPKEDDHDAYDADALPVASTNLPQANTLHSDSPGSLTSKQPAHSRARSTDLGSSPACAPRLLRRPSDMFFSLDAADSPDHSSASESLQNQRRSATLVPRSISAGRGPRVHRRAVSAQPTLRKRVLFRLGRGTDSSSGAAPTTTALDEDSAAESMTSVPE